MAKDGGGGTLILVGGAVAAWYFWPQISSFLGLGTPAAAAAGTTTTTPPATTTTAPAAPAAPAPPAFSQLDAIYPQLVQAAVNDYNKGDRSNQLTVVNGAPQTTFSAWNYFLNQVAPNIGTLPDYLTVTNQTDLNQPMTGPQYWAVMAPWLAKNRGFSGVGVYAGLAGLAYRGMGRMGRRR